MLVILCSVATLVPVAATSAVVFSFSSSSSHCDDRMNVLVEGVLIENRLDKACCNNSECYRRYCHQ